MKIVIVEDEIRIREGLARLLQKSDESYEVVGEAENGQDGLELITKVKPDVIITDIKMPVMDGLEMLTQLYNSGIHAKAIVLSAYSEFEYARQAMRLGVKEYLLKPIVLGEISESLQRVREELRLENEKPADVFGNQEQVFAGILTGTIEIDEQMPQKLKQYFEIPETAQYQGICLYLGDRYEAEKDDARKELENLLSERQNMKYLLVEMEREKLLTILVYYDEKQEELERWVQYWFLQSRNKKVKGGLGYISNLQLEDIKTGMETLLGYMDWNISLGDGVMISYPKITRLQTYTCVYPLEIENKMKLAVCTGQLEKIKNIFVDFKNYFVTEKIYCPREIKECYVRFLWAFMNTAKEVGILDYENLEQQKLLERIMGARTVEELNGVGEFFLSQIRDSGEEVLHLTVKRAQSMIQEFYHTGITLEEIASRLNITPEYLGTRFHQEVGMTFSTYIKNYRIKKAKELLIGTNLKLYEISGRVGYSDAKYFSRVFREITGQLPAEYRKTYK